MDLILKFPFELDQLCTLLNVARTQTTIMCNKDEEMNIAALVSFIE